MSNKGLKSYTKQITESLSDIISMSFNLSANDSNFHIIIPTVSSVGLNQIKPSLIFNYQDINTIGLFGRGFKLNYFAKIVEYSDKITLFNADGSSDDYRSNQSFKNPETNLKIGKYYDPYLLTYYFDVRDKYGNVMEYYADLEYPKYIKQKSGEKITIDFISLPKIIKNDFGDEIRFYKNGNLITKISYFHNNFETIFMELEYTNNYLTKLTTKQNNTIISEFSITYNANNIIILDIISQERLKFTFSSGKVSSYIRGFDSNFTNSHPINVLYDGNKTTVSDFLDNKLYVFFDNDNLPLFEMDGEGNVVKYDFDDETKLLLSKSNPVQVIHKEPNLFPSTVENYQKTSANVVPVECDVPFFSNILGDSVCRVSALNYSGSISYSIDIDGIGTDEITAVIWGKQRTPMTFYSYVKVTLCTDNNLNEISTNIFKKKSTDGLFDLMILGINPKKTYSKIILKFEIIGSTSIDVGGIQVIRKSFGSFYEYDEASNLIDLNNSGSSSTLNYDANNMPNGSINTDSSIFSYQYDNNGNLLKATTAYGSKIINNFNSTYRHNLTNSKISNRDESIILETRNEFTSDGRFVSKQYDELSNATQYLHDSLGRIIKVTNSLGIVNDTTYNADGTIQELLTSFGNQSSWVRYTYDSRKRPISILLKNGSDYSFVYDNYDNVTQISINNNILYSYVYNLSTGNLVSLKYGVDGDSYIFEYDSKSRIKKIYYKKNNVTTLKYQYVYNSLNQLTEIRDGSYVILKQYSYNSDGIVINEADNYVSVERKYDNLGNVIQKAVHTSSGSVIYQSFDSVSRSKGAHPDSLLGSYTIDDFQFVCTFMTDSVLRSKTKILPSIDHDEGTVEFESNFDGIIPYVSVDDENLLSYKLNVDCYYPDESGCVQFWFRPDENHCHLHEYIFSCKSSAGLSHIGIYYSNNKLHLFVTDMYGNDSLLISSDYNVNIGEWNFVALTFANRYDGPTTPDVCEYALMLNGHIQQYIKQNPRIYCDIGPYPIYNIGHNYNGIEVSDPFFGNIACLFVGARKYSDLNGIRKYYRITKDYFIDNQLIDENAKTVDFSQTNLFEISQNNQNLFEIFPLQSSVESLKGVKPIKFSIRDVSKTDKDRTFNFNKQIKRYAYVADGSELVYNFGSGDSGTVMMRAFTDSLDDKQFFFELIDDNDQNISLYRGADLKLYIDFKGTIISTNLSFANNSWHTVSLSFKKTYQPVSYVLFEYEYFRIMLDGVVFNYNMVASNTFGNLKLYIGRRKNGVTNVSNLGLSAFYYPLQGQIEMVATRNAYCEETTLSVLRNELIGITKINEFDELGLLKKTSLHKIGLNVLSKEFTYKKRSETSSYYSKEIVSEKIVVNGTVLTERNYVTDNLGRILSINDNVFGNHQYSYNYRGFLVEDDSVDITYDDNGNILSYGYNRYAYESDDGIVDLLTSYNGIPIIYNMNSLNPVSCAGNLFEFEGRKLISLTDSNGNICSYKYNDKGQRIEKIFNNISTRFSYENDKLISQYNNSQRLDFLYDENDSLYGFILNGNSKYFYIRDILQNILGIIDENGALVVKYSYNAFGKIETIEGSLANTIGIINPFKFKEYYYDNESSFYLIGTRFYNPFVGRFITQDSLESLKPYSINKLNCFSHSMNNPVVYKHILSSSLSIDSEIISEVSSCCFSGVNSYDVNSGCEGQKQSVPWWFSMICSASTDLILAFKYLSSKGMHTKFAYVTNTRYVFPIMGSTWRWFNKTGSSYLTLSQNTFKQIISGDARAGIGAITKSSIHIVGVNFTVNFVINLLENDWKLDKEMLIDTAIDTG